MLIGRSGSGKTTFLRCLNFLEEPTVGRVQHGRALASRPTRSSGPAGAARSEIRQIRQRTGMVFQEFNLFPHMTVLENCIEAPIAREGPQQGEAIATAERFLEKVRLLDKRDEYPARMSGGQKQRAAIARALCMEPQVLLFDEPTSALDPELIGEVVVVMEELAHEGATMIVVSHEMAFAREAADRVLYLEGGVIVEEGPPEQVLDEPREEATTAVPAPLPQRGRSGAHGRATRRLVSPFDGLPSPRPDAPLADPGLEGSMHGHGGGG